MFTKKILENKKQDVRDNRHRVLPSSHPSLGVSVLFLSFLC